MKHDGIAILITDHQVRETLQITDRSYVIRAGEVLCHGSPDEVLSHPEAREYYFGENMDLGHRAGPSLAGQPRRVAGRENGHGALNSSGSFAAARSCLPSRSVPCQARRTAVAKLVLFAANTPATAQRQSAAAG